MLIFGRMERKWNMTLGAMGVRAAARIGWAFGLSGLLAAAAFSQSAGGYVPARKGIEFGLNFGVYQANHKSATAFYSGTGYYDIGDNTARMYEIEERLLLNANTWNQVLNSIGLEAGEYRYIEYPYEMRYQVAPMFGLQTLLFFNPESAFVLHVDAISGLKSQGGFNIVSTDVDFGQGSENRRTYGIFSTEDRLLLSLGYRTAAYIQDEVSWVIELGGTMLNTRLQENYVRIEERNYDLMIGVQGNNAVNRPTSALTATGFGFYGVLGIELMFEEGGNLILSARVSRDDVRLGIDPELSYRDNLWQAGLYLTWVIPPQIGDFVRAKF